MYQYVNDSQPCSFSTAHVECLFVSILVRHHQCWGKLLLKVMHYNIALLRKKLITLLSYFLIEKNVMLLFKSRQGLLVCLVI